MANVSDESESRISPNLVSSSTNPPSTNVPYRETCCEAITKDSKNFQSPVLEVKVTYHLYQYGIKIRVKSVKNDGSQTWIVISRGTHKYVDELLEEHGKSIHHEKMVNGTSRPVATKKKEPSYPPFLNSQRCLCRHRGLHQEDDGAID